MTCKCFRCGQGFESVLEEDREGDGECSSCKERTKQIALRVDLDMEKRRRENPSRFKNQRADIIQDLIKNGGRINARELGLGSWGN